MAHSQPQDLPSCDAYFDSIQYKKNLPESLQRSLTHAFKIIPVSAFPEVPCGEVIEIHGDMPILEAVRVLSDNHIMAAPVLNPEPIPRQYGWQSRYLGILDYSAIIIWLLQNVDTAALSLAACGSAVVNCGATISWQKRSPVASPRAAKDETGSDKSDVDKDETGSDVASPRVAKPGVDKDESGSDKSGGDKEETGSVVGDFGVADEEEEPELEDIGSEMAEHLGEEIFGVLFEEEPFKSATAKKVVKKYRFAPFLPVVPESSMLTVLLLLSKYRLRNVPVVQNEGPLIINFITQTAIIRGLEKCKGRDWFDFIAKKPLTDFGLPFMSVDEMVSVNSDDLLMEAFKLMTENYIAGLPIFEGPNRKLVGNLSVRAVRFVLLRPDLFVDIRDLTVMEFIKTVGSAIPESGLSDPPLTCGPNDTMGSIIEKIASRYVHRIYVVEGNGTEPQMVVGIITLRDIISCFVTEPPDYLQNYLRDTVESFHQEIGEDGRFFGAYY
ncbi:hypothetical protein LUZ60_008552 [Juncus effusus]|nr:hypothetical protein LUZ60_008552 [Juncus effusus]